MPSRLDLLQIKLGLQRMQHGVVDFAGPVQPQHLLAPGRYRRICGNGMSSC